MSQDTIETKSTDPAGQLERQVIRPGNGWKHIGGPVYEHDNGTRVHTLGYVRLPNGDFLSYCKWPESQNAALMIRANGGNRKRGLMSWAMTYNALLRRGST